MKLFGIIYTGTIWPDFKGIMGPGSDCKGVMHTDCKGVIGSGDGCKGIIINADGCFGTIGAGGD